MLLRLLTQASAQGALQQRPGFACPASFPSPHPETHSPAGWQTDSISGAGGDIWPWPRPGPSVYLVFFSHRADSWRYTRLMLIKVNFILAGDRASLHCSCCEDRAWAWSYRKLSWPSKWNKNKTKQPPLKKPKRRREWNQCRRKSSREMKIKS